MSGKSKKTLLLINSFGHSGTTIFDKTIGTCFNAFSLGEFVNFPKVIEQNNFCTCEKKICNCLFWKKIISNFDFDNDIQDNFKSLSSYNRFLKNFIFKRDEIRKSINIVRFLYDQIFLISEAKIIVDSSKNFIWNFALFCYLKKIYNIKVIHIVRDPRGVYCSYKKTHWKLPSKVKGHPSTGKRNIYKRTPTKTLPIIFKWTIKNIIIFLTQKIFIRENNYLIVNFDQFTESPEKSIKFIEELLEIKSNNKKGYKSIGEKKLHMVTGNASRFYNGPIQNIRDNWKNKIDKKTLLIIKVLTLPARRLLGI